MTDLTSLCKICHTNPPQYTCPRCSLRTCSLACIQTHKRRAPCSGVRDPTVYKPMRELATPAGIDHDYNFISAIERGIERTDRLLCDEKGIVTQRELREGPQDPNVRMRGKRGKDAESFGGRHLAEAEKNVRRAQAAIGVTVERLPKGMARQKANGTSWSKKQKCVVWQVEWVREAESTVDQTINQEEVVKRDGGVVWDKVNYKTLTTTPISVAYANMIEERRRNAMTPEQRAEEKKKRAQEVAEEKAEAAKRAKLEAAPAAVTVPIETARTEETPDIQPESEAKDVPEETSTKPTEPAPAPQQPQQKLPNDYTFYLLKPRTPSNLPTVLIPLDSSHSLDQALKGKTIVEYPTIYAFPVSMTSLPEGFMLEKEFLRLTGGEESESEEDEGGEVKEELVSDTSSSGSSSEDSDSDDESEDEDDEEGGIKVEENPSTNAEPTEAIEEVKKEQTGGNSALKIEEI